MIDLQPFCELPRAPSRRYKLTAPFVQRGYRYGTDGAICVRVPTDEADTPPTAGDEKLRLPPAHSIPWQQLDDETLGPWRTLLLVI